MDSGTYSRFLIKELLPKPNDSNSEESKLKDQMDEIGTKTPDPKWVDAADYGYDWQYLAFLTLWFISVPNKDKPKLALLCFDQSLKMKTMLLEGIERVNPDICRNCPHGIYEALILPIVACYDRALWAFQKPVRGIEKVCLAYVFTMLWLTRLVSYQNHRSRALRPKSNA